MALINHVEWTKTCDALCKSEFSLSASCVASCYGINQWNKCYDKWCNKK